MSHSRIGVYVLAAVLIGCAASLFAPRSWTVSRLNKELKETVQYLRKNTGSGEPAAEEVDKDGKTKKTAKKKKKTSLANRFKPNTNERIGKAPVSQAMKKDTDGDGRADGSDYYPFNPDFQDKIRLEVQSVHRGYGENRKQSANVKIKGGDQFYVKIGDKIPKATYTGKNKMPAVQIIAIEAATRTVTIVDLTKGKTKRMSTKRSYRQEAD